MNKIFSADDIEHFWSPPPPPAVGPLPVHEPSVRELAATNSSSSSAINRSPSEWAFQRFLQEASDDIHRNPNPCFPSESPISSTTTSTPAILNDVDEIKDYEPHANYDDDHYHHTICGQTKSSELGRGSFGDGVTYPPMDSEGYQAFLKSRLHLECAAVALNAANSTKPMECSVGVVAENGLLISNNTSQVGSTGAASKRQDKDAGNPLGGTSLPAVQRLSVIPVRSATSGSSREDSDEDEVEGETEMTQNMDPADTKRMRRMLSNRESARRSRRRKQAHISDIETQVSQLRVENSSFLKRFADISQKYNEAAVDNRVLKADVETLRAKVKMAEETVKRVTGLSPFFQAMSEISTISMPSFAASLSDISVEDQKQHLHQSPVTSHHLHAHEPQRINSASLDMHSVNGMYQSIATAAGGGGGDKLGRTTSMQRVDSLEHLQKCIRGEFGS